MGQPPTISIIIPVLDEGAVLPARLAELAPLRDQGAELIVVDGGSRDDSRQHAAAVADRLIVARRGRARQMNAGAAIARGRLLLFLHADTALPPGALAALHDALARGVAWGRFDVRIAGRHPLLRVVATMMNLRSRVTGIATGDQAIFVDRAAFHAAGGFPDLPLMEDIAFSQRLRRLARPACLRLMVTTAGRRWETHGVWRTMLLMWRLRAAFHFGADPRQLALRYGYRPDDN